MLKLKLQYFGHMMWRAYSLEKTLMLGKTEGKRRGGPVDMRLRKLRSSEGQGSLPSCSSRGHSQAWLSHWTAATHRRVYFTQPSVQSVQFSRSVVSDSLRTHEPHSTPGLPVHHQLPEFTQTHVHRVGDAIQLSHPLSSPSPPAPSPRSIRVFSSESTLRMR